MKRSGAFGASVTASALLVASVFVGCGGSSKSQGGGGDDDGSGKGGTGPNGRGGSSSGSGGVSGNGASGASSGGSGAATPIPPPGPSYCGGQACDPPFSCCLSTGECFDPRSDAGACDTPTPDLDPQGRKACASSSQCNPGEFCMMDGVLCLGTGHCQPIDNCGFCGSDDPLDPNPECRVCGCDGNTYPNFQTACLAGVNTVASSGAACGETNTEGGGGSSTTGPREFIACGHDGNCPSGSFCCAMAARCYLEADRDICVPPPPGARLTCRTNQNCADFEYCSGEGCTALGGCVNRGPEDECGVTLEPVCGCDGTTYTSAGCAANRGVRVDFVGECGGE